MLILGCFDIGSITVSTVTRGTTATITFSSHQDATFTCQLDSGTAVTCKLNLKQYSLQILQSNNFANRGTFLTRKSCQFWKVW